MYLWWFLHLIIMKLYCYTIPCVHVRFFISYLFIYLFFGFVSNAYSAERDICGTLCLYRKLEKTAYHMICVCEAGLFESLSSSIYQEGVCYWS